MVLPPMPANHLSTESGTGMHTAHELCSVTKNVVVHALQSSEFREWHWHVHGT